MPYSTQRSHLYVSNSFESKEQAFICNLAAHWLTIRKAGNRWFNLNSLLDEPQYLSDFYLRYDPLLSLDEYTVLFLIV